MSQKRSRIIFAGEVFELGDFDAVDLFSESANTLTIEFPYIKHPVSLIVFNGQRFEKRSSDQNRKD